MILKADIGRVLSMNPAEENTLHVSRTDQCPTRADTTGEILFFSRETRGGGERKNRAPFVDSKWRQWEEERIVSVNSRSRIGLIMLRAVFTTDYERKKTEIYSLFAPLFSFAEDTR